LTAIAKASGVIDYLNRASLRLRFNKGEVDPRIICGRTTVGSYFDSTGTLQSAAIGVPRLTYDPANLSADPGLLAEDSRTNSIRNSTMQGSVAGTPGTLPTNWLITSAAAGLTRSIVGFGEVGKLPYIDIRLAGTKVDNSSFLLFFDGSTQVSASASQVWTGSFYVAIVGGSLSGVSSLRNRIAARNTSGGATQNAQMLFSVSSDGSFSRISQTISITESLTAFIHSGISVEGSAGAEIDITLRIGLPQLELGASASSPIPTSGAASTRSADNLSMTDMSWYSASGGVLYVDYERRDGLTSDKWVLGLWQDANNRIEVMTGSSQRARVVASGVVTNLPTHPQSPLSKFAARFVQGLSASSANGLPATTGTLPSIPLPVGLALGGQGYTNNTHLNGLIREIAFIPDTSIPDSALQRMTR
jgi:hypothetical protein